MPSDVLLRLIWKGLRAGKPTRVEYLMPSSPGASQLKDQAPQFASWLTGQHQAGLATCRGLVIAVAKPETGSRPSGGMGICRASYLPSVDGPPRVRGETPGGPLDRGVPNIRLRAVGIRAPEMPGDANSILSWPKNSAVQYVLKADIASFYDPLTR